MWLGNSLSLMVFKKNYHVDLRFVGVACLFPFLELFLQDFERELSLSVVSSKNGKSMLLLLNKEKMVKHTDPNSPYC
jgi:urease accessory protein UreE